MELNIPFVSAGNFKFRFPKKNNSINEYKKKHIKFKDEIEVNQILWDWNTMVGKKYDGGFFTGSEEIEQIELPKKDVLTYEEIFNLYNDLCDFNQDGIINFKDVRILNLALQ